jgi:putative sigma-54 modulation protein
MQVELRGANRDVAAVLQPYLERRLRFALGRFGSRVGQVLVTITRNGGAHTGCRISTGIVPFGRIDVEEIALDLFTAIDRAAGRVGRVFGRELERLRDARRTRESVRLVA